MRALLYVFLSPDVRLRIAVSQCEHMFDASHAPHTSYGQRFHRDQIGDLWRAGERVRICAVHIWLISKKGSTVWI